MSHSSEAFADTPTSSTTVADTAAIEATRRTKAKARPIREVIGNFLRDTISPIVSSGERRPGHEDLP